MTPGQAPGDSRRRLLAVSALPPWPVRDGYSLRVSNFLSELAREWSVTLVSPATSRSPGEIPTDVRWHRVEGVPATDTLPWREERDLLVDGVRSELASGEFHAGLTWSGVEFVATEIPGFPPAVLDRIDCGTLVAWRQAWSVRGLRRRMQMLRRAAELLLYERRALRPFLSVAVTGPADAAVLRTISRHGRIIEVPNGVHVPDPGSLPGEGETPVVIFTGVLAYGPNVEAARHFADDVWPEVRRRIPEARFVVAGRSPTDEVLALEDRPGVEVHADVPDMTEEIRRAWLAVAPMRSGAGIKNKVLEAWAAERPVVLTQMAANGLALDEERRRLVTSDPEEMADIVVRLLSDRSLRRRLGEESRRHAEERHGWARVSRELNDLLLEAAA